VPCQPRSLELRNKSRNHRRDRPYRSQACNQAPVGRTPCRGGFAIATAQTKNGVVELAGPEASSMAEFIQSFLSSKGDERKVIPDPDAKYFGAVLDKDGLAPTGQFIAGPTRFADWARS
jgi:hypothetical protein